MSHSTEDGFCPTLLFISLLRIHKATAQKHRPLEHKQDSQNKGAAAGSQHKAVNKVENPSPAQEEHSQSPLWAKHFISSSQKKQQMPETLPGAQITAEVTELLQHCLSLTQSCSCTYRTLPGVCVTCCKIGWCVPCLRDAWHSSKQVCAEVWGEYPPIRREFQPWEMYCCKKKVLEHKRLCKLLFPDFRSCVPWLHIHPCSTHTLDKAVLT